MTEQVVEVKVLKGRLKHPESRVAVPGPAAERVETVTATSAPSTRASFENALDKVSRPVRGKYADIPTSSEEFAKRKQEEIDLEERR
jgi:hypothetical protein